MKTIAKKIVEKVLSVGDAEATARKQLQDLLAQIKADRAEVATLAAQITGWEKELDAIHDKGLAVNVSDGEAAQALLGKIDVANIRAMTLNSAQSSNQNQIDWITSHFPRLRAMVTE